MSRRTSAGVTAVVLLVATWLVATLVPTNYVVYSPGPTVNLLAKEKGGDLIRVSGAKAYRDKGALRLLTVVPTGPDDRVYLAEAMFAWLNPKQAVYRESDIYQPQENSDKVEAESAVDMVNSQDSAIASALHGAETMCQASKISRTAARTATSMDELYKHPMTPIATNISNPSVSPTRLPFEGVS